jgi:hypothetical protein
VNREHPTCTFREGELVVNIDTGSLDSIKEIIGSFIEVGRVGTGDTLPADLRVLRIAADPLVAAVQLAGAEIEASPNYLYAFSPGWRYGPFDTPTILANVPTTPVTWSDNATIAVLDTGWSDLTTLTDAAKSVVLRPSAPPLGAINPPAQTEVTTGVAAGHGTFIINELGQMLPNASFIAAGISPRYADDDAYTPFVDEPAVSIRDDSTVTAAIGDIANAPAGFLNASFGSYGCTALHIPKPGVDAGSGDDIMEPYYEPLGLRTVLEEKLDGLGTQVFAASGNDGHGPYGEATPEIFYPAGFAPDYLWLHSVASDPKNGVEDYSNRGPWVETQARGSRTVSQLPVTATPPAGWGSEGWYEWSGTSFAAPCALAYMVHDLATTNPPTPTPDKGYDPAGPYLECALNLA